MINNGDARKKIQELTADIAALDKKQRELKIAGDTKGVKDAAAEIKRLQKELSAAKKFGVDVDATLRSINKLTMR